MALNLEKRTSTLTLSLVKRGIVNIKAQVGSVFDRSGSMDNLYNNGTMQEYTNRLVPLGLKFDDNGQIDNWAFHNKSFSTGPITVDNVETFVKKNIMTISSGGTSFVPVLEAVELHYFGTVESPKPVVAAKPKGFLRNLFGASEQTEVAASPKTVVSDAPVTGDPVYLIFQTDGENNDHEGTDRVLARLEHRGIYIQFVGIGNERFSFISEMADKYSNVGFFKINDLEKTEDETLYDLLINAEFKTFLKTKFPNNIQEK